MKKIVLIFIFLLASFTSLQAQQIGGKFKYVASYENGQKLNTNVAPLGATELLLTLWDMPGMTPALLVTGSVTTFYGSTNAFALPMGGNNNYSYVGTDNGWYVFRWGPQTVLVDGSNSVVRLVPMNDRNRYAEYRK